MEKNELLEKLDDENAIKGVIQKNAIIKSFEVTDNDLEKINKYTLSPVTKEEVFVFKTMVADNEQDDRNYMPFDRKALDDLKDLYLGKTMIKDHEHKADNQIARVFDTEIIEDANKTTGLDEVHAELFTKNYMIITESNKDLIAEIKGGIKKEVSTSTVPKEMKCTVCGTDNMNSWCSHYPGISYKTDSSEDVDCKMILSGAKEAYELSFVAIPAQPRAGTSKSFGFVKPVDKPQEKEEKIEESKEKEMIDTQFKERFERMQSFFNARKEED